ncbi:MAG: putative Na+/H+ antiporter, partial [Verrucomicrobiota bacterium]|jgi:hypothetical protein
MIPAEGPASRVLLRAVSLGLALPGIAAAAEFPRSVTDYAASDVASLGGTLLGRATAEPFNVVATVIFALAVAHTFLTARFRHWAHAVEERHLARLRQRPAGQDRDGDGQPDEVSFGGQVLHFLGEVEAVFGLWAIVLGVALAAFKGVDTSIHYLADQVNYTEPMFVVIIMALASTRPVLRLAEQCMQLVASLGGGRPVAWWLSILTLAPILGSFITEPAAMTIAALLLGKQFYALNPGTKLKYATIGLLFVNVSIGGTLTHFAAPPVLMVAAAWGWNISYMFTHFGWHAISGIVLANAVYLVAFRRELFALQAPAAENGPRGEEPVPVWVTTMHLGFLGFTVWMAHHPALFIGGFLFYLAFAQATAHHQSKVELKTPLLVGFFLAGLVIHGGLQAWWIQPVLSRLGEVPLFAGATILTAFNDNALITYLATLVPGFSEELKFAVVSGAVTGGGLTVIANAPNPAGQSILQRYFPEGVSPLGLFLGALVPTLIVAFSFMVL